MSVRNADSDGAILSKRRTTYSVESTVGITVGHNLQSRVHAVRERNTERLLVERDVRETESTQSGEAEGRDKGDVEVVARVVTETQEHLDGRLAVAHGQGDRDGILRQGQHRPLGGLAHSTAGERGHGVLIEATARGVVELEVGGRERNQSGEGEERELHGDSCFVWKEH